jgi:hypothetical protein
MLEIAQDEKSLSALPIMADAEQQKKRKRKAQRETL